MYYQRKRYCVLGRSVYLNVQHRHAAHNHFQQIQKMAEEQIVPSTTVLYSRSTGNSSEFWRDLNPVQRRSIACHEVTRKLAEPKLRSIIASFGSTPIGRDKKL